MTFEVKLLSCIMLLARFLYKLLGEVVLALDILCALSLVAFQDSVMAFFPSSQNVVSHIFCIVTPVPEVISFML